MKLNFLPLFIFVFTPLLIQADDAHWGDIKLENITEDKEIMQIKPLMGVFPCPAAKNHVISIIGNKITLVTNNTAKSEIPLNAGDYAESIIWISNTEALISIWHEKGDGASSHFIQKISIDDHGDIKSTAVMSRFEEHGLVLMGFLKTENDMVQVRARTGKTSFKYVIAWVSVEQLTNLPHWRQDDMGK